MLHPKFIQSVLVFGTLFLGTFSHADIIVDSYSHATNDRFSNDPNFVAAGFNLSGVGQTSGGTWGTAISNNVVISANHFAPSGTLFFYPGNDANVVPISRQIVSGQKVGATDIWLGVLDQPLPNNISYYPVANEFLTATPSTAMMLNIVDAGSYQPSNAYLFGRSPFDENLINDNRFSSNDQAVGRNRVTGYAENVPFSDTDNDVLIFNFDAPSAPNFVPNEALFQGGDSGGPTFANIAGQLVLLGTNAFILDDSSASGINYVGNQFSTIQNFIQLNAVPEPGVSVLILMTGATLICHSRRRHAHRLGSRTCHASVKT